MKPSTQTREDKLSYVATYQPWSWVIGTGVYLDDIHKDMLAAQTRFKEQFREQLSLTGVLFLAAVLIALFFITLFSRNIKSSLLRFRDFFIASTSEYALIDTEQLPFTEFSEIANQANVMNRARREAEAKLRESEQSYRELFDSATAVIYTMDLSGRFLSVNPAMKNLFGYNEEAFLGRTPADFMKPEFADLFQSEYLAEIVKNGRHEGIASYFSKDGRKIYIEYKSELVQPEKGSPYISGIGRDVTDRVLAERERKQLEAQLQQAKKLEAIGTLAGGMAHLFNNQLSVVLGNLELALADLPAHHQSRKDLQQAMKSARRASEVSGQLLTYLGQGAGKREAWDLSEICRQNLRMLTESLPETVVLETELMTPGPVVMVNAHQIEQILSNLITNAWEAMEQHRGTIGLVTNIVAQADILQSDVFPHDWEPRDGEYACLEVWDTGSGMDTEDIDKIFDPFFTTKFTGRGLGLAVVSGIIKSCGGAISLHTEKLRGSRLRIYLPLVRDIPPKRPEKPAEEPRTVSGKTILIAEDQEMVRNMATTMLEHLGYSVIPAADGREAIELFQSHQGQISCLLTDLSMPGMDGWETLEAIRKIQPDLPVILASGYDQAQVMNGEHSERPQAYLNKPFQMAELKAALAQVLGKTSAKSPPDAPSEP